MSKKRFTDITKWKRPWFQALSRDAKLLWLFLCDDCDHAGIWIADFDLLSLRLGMRVDEAKMRELVGDKLIKLDLDKYFIPSFFEFQYGESKEGFKAKQSALKSLRHWNLLADDDSLIDLSKSYLRVSGESPDCHIISKSKSKSKSKSNTGGVGEIYDLALDSDYESVYKLYPKKIGKSDGLKKLKKICPSKTQLALYASAQAAYVAQCKANDTFLKQFDTFVNSNWMDCLEPGYGEAPKTPAKNSFKRADPSWSDMAKDLWAWVSDGCKGPLDESLNRVANVIGREKLLSLHRDDFRPHGIVPGLLKDASQKAGAA